MERTAIKSWKKGSIFLNAIDFIAVDYDENGKFISLITDEEGNSDIRLDRESALWLSQELKKYAEEIMFPSTKAVYSNEKTNNIHKENNGRTKVAKLS